MDNVDFAEGRAEILRELAPPLPIADITTRARRRTKTRAMLSVTAAVAVLAGSIVGLQTISPKHGQAAAAAGPLVATPYEGPLPAGSKSITAAAVNEKQTYALGSLPGKGAGFFWSRTTDGGQTWTTVKLPKQLDELTTNSEPRANLFVLDSDTVVLRNLITHDGGATWAQRPAAGEPVKSVPAGWRFVPGFSFFYLGKEGPSISEPVGGEPNAPRGMKAMLATIDPKDGQLHKVSGVPENCGVPDASGEASDSSFWLTCAGAVAVSHDRGESWKKASLPGVPADTPLWADSADGKRGYAVASSRSSGTTYPLYGTTDGGTTWQLLRQVPLLSGLTMLPDGSYVCGGDTATTAPLKRTTDSGASFQPLQSTVFPTANPARTVTGSYVSFHWESVGSPHNKYLVSDDGLHWAVVPAPPGATAPEL
jgi:photosystem II stability/assembly factor-like uncharacterized protein